MNFLTAYSYSQNKNQKDCVKWRNVTPHSFRTMDENKINSKLLKLVTDHYLNSDDFNGFNLNFDNKKSELSPEQFREWIGGFIKKGEFSLRYGDFHCNPSIRRMPDLDKEKDLELLAKSKLDTVVAYPTSKVLENIVKKEKYKGRPFSLRLALGEAHMDYHCFDLSVLEFYRNDPRYYYKVNDVNGSIYLKDEYSQSANLSKSDHVFLQTFGFAYDKDMNRYVAVYTWYLHKLSKEHQQIWDAKRNGKKYQIHPDYIKTSIYGQFPDHVPILVAFSSELDHVNKMCKLIGNPPLFINTLKDEKKPRNFTFLIRPTSKEFYDFVLLLDQTMSDNLNKDFFRDDLELEEEVQRQDGKIEVRQKSTITLLIEWFEKYFEFDDRKPFDEMISSFKKVRKLRMKPAHSLVDNNFDQEFFKQQRELIKKAYSAVKLIRIILNGHSACRDYKVEDVLYEGRIRTY